MEAMRVQTVAGIEPRMQAGAAMAVRVLVLTDRPDSHSAQRLASYGCLVEVGHDIAGAVAAMAEDPFGFDLLVMDCDAFGGIAAAERVISTLIAANVRMRFLLVSQEFDVPAYPLGVRSAVCLPDTVAEAGFRRGFDHALRDRSAVPLI